MNLDYDEVMKGRQADIAPRLAAAAKKANDPQSITLMLTVLKNVPWTADSSKPLWRHVFTAVAASKSPRFTQEAEAIRGGFAVRPLMKTWLDGQFKKAIKGLPAGKAAPAPVAEKKKKTADASSLLAAVYAKPSDDAPRHVYADFLIERGDPRGEFIALQLGGTDTKKQKKLLAAHGKEWLGGIAPVVAANVEFQRGFLSKAVAKFRHEADAKKFGDLPEWSTVESLSWTGPTPRPAGQAKFIDYLGPTMVSLKQARQPHGPSALAATLPQLEVLDIELPPMDLVALLASKNFPKLHTLRFDGFVDESFFRNVKRIGAVKHFSAGVRSKEKAAAIAAAALECGFETVELSGVKFDGASAPKKGAQGLPELGIGLAIGTRTDGAVIAVDEENVFVFDAGLSKVLDAWPMEKADRAQVTPDGKCVVVTSYRQLIGIDTTSGKTLFDIAHKAIENHYRGQLALSDDGRKLSVAGDVVIDLKTKKEVPRPRGSTKARFTDPDQQWWCMSHAGNWTLARVGSKVAVPLAPYGVREAFSRSAGVVHFSRDDAFTAFDVATGEKLGHFEGSHALLAYSNDGTHVALSSDKGVKILDVRTLAVKKQLKQPANEAAFSPDGAALLIISGGKVLRAAL